MSNSYARSASPKPTPNVLDVLVTRVRAWWKGFVARQIVADEPIPVEKAYVVRGTVQRFVYGIEEKVPAFCLVTNDAEIAAWTLIAMGARDNIAQVCRFTEEA